MLLLLKKLLGLRPFVKYLICALGDLGGLYCNSGAVFISGVSPKQHKISEAISSSSAVEEVEKYSKELECLRKFSLLHTS
eukprot:snap_masked-scaffold_11-processed-gene-4.5-mRNA-1 protein AED:1.00 eAED:1.00 QI:0/0/0/0/1/1/2/0/79